MMMMRSMFVVPLARVVSGHLTGRWKASETCEELRDEWTVVTKSAVACNLPFPIS